jgi:membrane dipeptidase
MTPIVDGHLDLAYGVTRYGRNLELTPHRIRVLETEQSVDHGLAMVTLPEMRRAGVAVAFATLFSMPAVSWTTPGVVIEGGYRTPEEAQAQALEQLRVYDDWAARGLVRLIRSVADLEHHLELWRDDGVTGLVVLMEGADPIVTPDDLDAWWERGVRIIGTSWGATRYAGGTEAPGGLSAIGRELIAAMQARGVILDASHQSWEAFWESLEVGVHRVIASHSNPFALRATTNRHLTDAMIRAIGERDGVVGVVLLNAFLDARWTRANRVPITLDHVKRHLAHHASLIGWNRVGIGSDLDGGFGSLETPGLDTITDLRRIGDLVPEEARAGVLGENWISFLRRALPGTQASNTTSSVHRSVRP